MDDDPRGATQELPAGEFRVWLEGTRRALRSGGAADVPCGTCTACCRASQFVHIAPDERATLARIPRKLLFPAPRMAAGHVLLGYDENGCCPMLTDDGCSIYAHRPRTCRSYDCRVFTAAGVEPDEEQDLVAQRVRQWRFDYASAADRAAHEEVRATARDLEAEGVTANKLQIAVRAVSSSGDVPRRQSPP